MHNTWPPGYTGGGEEELMERLRNGITALSLFSEESALMSKLFHFLAVRPFD
jgi:hypothetical protein